MATKRTQGQLWKDTGWYYEPHSASDVMTTIARVGTHGSNHRFAWRGLANCNFSLTSSLHRRIVDAGLRVEESLLREWEDHILEDARRWGLGVEGGQLVDDLQLLADLQHFGIPTRLIDVTSNPMTALWFATQREEHSTIPSLKSATGLLVAINMRWYNEVAQDKKPQTVFKTVGEPTEGKTADRLSAKREAGLALKSPFVVSSSMPNPRLRAQEGYFLASAHPRESTDPMTSLQMEIPWVDQDEVRKLLKGEKGRGMPRIFPFVAIFINARVKNQLKQYLRRTYSKTAKTLFPDYPGFLKYGEWEP